MNLAFSDEQEQLRHSLHRLLSDRCGSRRLHELAATAAPFDRELWKDLADVGFQGARVPEAFGGVGAGFLELCVMSEELGRSLAPVPVVGSVFLATEALLLAGTEAQRQAHLPRLACGDVIGTMVVGSHGVALQGDRLFGEARAVLFGASADLAIIAVDDRERVCLRLVDLGQRAVRRQRVTGVDPLIEVAALTFDSAVSEPLGASGQAEALTETILSQAAVLTAFNQLGGATAALETAVAYAKGRVAFGRPIGSFQAVKHALADMYVSVELARSNCFHAAWALCAGSTELSIAAATARLSATSAYQHVSRNNTQVHGGLGFTWEADCHLHYRRSALLAAALGARAEWESRLVEHLKVTKAA